MHTDLLFHALADHSVFPNVPSSFGAFARRLYPEGFVHVVKAIPLDEIRASSRRAFVNSVNGISGTRPIMRISRKPVRPSIRGPSLSDVCTFCIHALFAVSGCASGNLNAAIHAPCEALRQHGSERASFIRRISRNPNRAGPISDHSRAFRASARKNVDRQTHLKPAMGGIAYDRPDVN
jgi:hypothetical protein